MINPTTHPTCVQNAKPNALPGDKTLIVLGTGAVAPGPYAACAMVWGWLGDAALTLAVADVPKPIP